MADPILVPINHVSTAKQDLFDIIIGRKIPEDATVPALAVPTWYLIKGDYETIYKMMINREMILAAYAKCYDNGMQQTSPLLDASIRFCAHPEGTVGGKPVIEVDSDGEPLIYIDCNNAIYSDPNEIPFDDAHTPKGDTGGFVVDPGGPGGTTK